MVDEMIDWMGLFYCVVLYAGVWVVDYKLGSK